MANAVLPCRFSRRTRVLLIAAVCIFTLAFWCFGTRINPSTSFRLAFHPSKNTISLPISTSPPNYRRPPQAPPTFTATPDIILEETKRQIVEAKKVEDDVVAAVTKEQASFKNVILPRTLHNNELELEIQVNTFYQYISPDDGVRESSRAAAKLWSDYWVEAAMREDIFALVNAVLQKDEELAPESKLLLEKEHNAYVRNGLGVPAGKKRDRFKEIKKRLTDLKIQFEKTLNEETDGLWLTLEELDGVPKDLVNSLKKGEGEHEGKVWLTFKYPDLFPTLRYANNASLREKYFVANENKCNSNCAPFTEIMILRDEAARLLGYNNHAEFRLEDNMAKTPKTVNDFLADLRQRLTPLGEAEKKVLLKLKEDELKAAGRESEIDGHYYLWDHRYYDRLMVEEDYDLDQERVSEWFPVTDTINGMLNIFGEFFGLKFFEIVGADRDALAPSGNGSDIVWHPDVILYSVWDDEGEGGGFVGYLYLDLHPRDGKYGHAANFSLHPGYIDANGKRRYPATALVCNFSKPLLKKPGLLKHSEIITLFHELGHGIHNLVSRTIYAQFHGTNTVRDFVEAPSQMLENWGWEPAQLKNLSRHYSYTSKEYGAEYASTTEEQVPEKIPDDLIEKVIKTRHVNDALFNLRQLHFGLYDMSIHQPKSHEDIEKTNFSVTFNKMRSEFSGIDGLEVKNGNWTWGNGQACFDHLVSGGYDACYYSYLSSQAYSTDMFHSVFANDPMNPKEGRRYRHMVLEKGGSQPEIKTLEDFLGRKPNNEAFLEELGLSSMGIKRRNTLSL